LCFAISSAVPQPRRRPSLEETARARYPEADELAERRIWAMRTIFFDTKTHKRLPEYADAPEQFFLGVLIVANARALELGVQLRLSSEERKIWNRAFQDRL
jgi:hypothetical protein